ncbi:hypothetical protein GW17_00039803 [Ensete ventricosum]|nr:hypothetical protein GW17_00039803 [Ensete ventricosum]
MRFLGTYPRSSPASEWRARWDPCVYVVGPNVTASYEPGRLSAKVFLQGRSSDAEDMGVGIMVFLIIEKSATPLFPSLLISHDTFDKERKREGEREREMASGLVLTSIRPAVIRASTGDGRGRRMAPAKAAGGGGNTWWVPLFGWSSEPDYIDGPVTQEASVKGVAAETEGKSRRPAGRRFATFTEEKARELRMRTMETEAFHDVMYHSAIASRLASDLPRRTPGTSL